MPAITQNGKSSPDAERIENPFTGSQGLQRSIELFKAFRTEQTDPDHFYQLQARDAVRQVSRHAPLDGATVFDVGGGVGYSTDAFRRAGARCVLVEPFLQVLQAGVEEVSTEGRDERPHRISLAADRTVPKPCLIGDGFQLPITDSTADVCFSSNVLEHVENPQNFISELVRVTKPNGIIYVSFTNWYSPWGGHETAPWHYFGGEWSGRWYRRRTGYEPLHQFGESLFPVHVGPLLRWIQRWNDVELVEAVPRYYPSWCNWVVRVPIVRELASWNLLLILRKRSPEEDKSQEAVAEGSTVRTTKVKNKSRARDDDRGASTQEASKLPLQVRHPWRHTLRRGKNLLGHEPVFLPILLRMTPLGTSRRITESTDLVIEGFPRSGNTFTTFAIEDASGHTLTIASHVHQPAQVKDALAHGVPTVLVIRDPVSALASYLVYDERFSVSGVIEEYCSYHRQLVPYAERLLICEFEEITNEMPSVVDRINQRYELDIPPFDDDPSNVKRVMAQIELRHKLVHPKLDPAQSAASPQSNRRIMTERMRDALLNPRNAEQLSEAREYFEFFCTVASRQREVLSERRVFGNGATTPPPRAR